MSSKTEKTPTKRSFTKIHNLFLNITTCIRFSGLFTEKSNHSPYVSNTYEQDNQQERPAFHTQNIGIVQNQLKVTMFQMYQYIFDILFQLAIFIRHNFMNVDEFIIFIIQKYMKKFLRSEIANS